jgi:glutaredoxin 3
MYSTRFCPYCIAAKRLLQNKGVDYQDMAVDGKPELRHEMIEKSGRHTVPQIWIGDVHVGGYDDLNLLERSGKLDNLLNLS